MNLTYVGPRKKTFGIVGNATGARYSFTPGQPTAVDDADGAAILTQYPGLFVAQEPIVSEPKARKGRPAAEPESAMPEVEPVEQE